MPSLLFCLPALLVSVYCIAIHPLYNYNADTFICYLLMPSLEGMQGQHHRWIYVVDTFKTPPSRVAAARDLTLVSQIQIGSWSRNPFRAQDIWKSVAFLKWFCDKQCCYAVISAYWLQYIAVLRCVHLLGSTEFMKNRSRSLHVQERMLSHGWERSRSW